MNDPKIAAAVLAAGKSERMGSPKALLDAGEGQTFLERILSRAREGGIRRLLVVLRAEDVETRTAAERAHAACVENPDPSLGPISSIRCALDVVEAEGFDALLVWPVDMPLVTSGTVARLREAFRPDGPATVLPVHDGRRGHPVIHGHGVWADLRSSRADTGARVIVREDPARVLEVAVDDPGVLLDIDTPREYRRLRPRG